MAINDLGYRKWGLEPKNNSHQWRTIAAFGVRVAWRSTWLKRIFVMAWIPIFLMGAYLFVIEQSIQDIDSNDLLKSLGRGFVTSIVIERPEIRNLLEITQWSKHSNSLNKFLDNIFNGQDTAEEISPKSLPSNPRLRQLMQTGITFEVKDLEFVINLTDEQIQKIPELINLNSFQQLRSLMPRNRRGPPIPLFKQSVEDIKYAQSVAVELIEYDNDGNEFIDFKELVNYLRPTLWSEVLFLFFRLPQAFSVVLVIGMVAPKLISRDMKNRAFLLYYSRPIKPWQYLLGKCAIIWAFLVGLTTLPALMLYILGLSLSPDITVFFVTWQLPLKIMLASVILCVPTTLFALMLSSLTRESRIASFSWFSVWIMGSVAYFIMTIVETARALQQQTNVPSEQARIAGETFAEGKWAWLSPMQTLGNLQSWVFGIEREFGSLTISFLAVGLISVICLLILRWRIVLPIRV